MEEKGGMNDDRVEVLVQLLLFYFFLVLLFVLVLLVLSQGLTAPGAGGSHQQGVPEGSFVRRGRREECRGFAKKHGPKADGWRPLHNAFISTKPKLNNS